jgi:transcriptional regulator with GAF, ATPase, and Fis domain
MTPVRDDLATRLAGFARDLQQQQGPDEVLQALVRGALAIVPGAQEASVSRVVARRRVRSQAASGPLPRALDALQEQVGQGPCLDAVWDAHTVSVPDLGDESRWPRFSARAAELGAGSMLSFQLWVEDDHLGALNLSARRAAAFDDASVEIGRLFAVHAALAYAATQREAALERALLSRQLVGQAQGILMERERMTAEQAFGQLTRASQHGNVKLHEVARRLVESGDLPYAS